VKSPRAKNGRPVIKSVSASLFILTPKKQAPELTGACCTVISLKN
jgi:hypothetical protein